MKLTPAERDRRLGLRPVPADTILVGAYAVVYGRPEQRPVFNWRCACGWTGNNYPSATYARGRAEQHRRKDHADWPVTCIRSVS